MSKGGLAIFRPALSLIAVSTFLWAPYLSNAQQAEAPIYKDGDWWRVKVDVIRPPGVSIAGVQLERFAEYIVRFESGKPKVLGVQGNETQEIDLPIIISLVLGRPGWSGDLLRFPMRVGLAWSDRFQFPPPGAQMRWEEGRYEVQAWEKFKTPKGDFNAFKLVMNMSAPKSPKGGTEVRTRTYHYAPDVKAIASLQTSGTEARVASTLIDFSLAK